MKSTICLLFCFIAILATAQQTPTELAQPIVKEGKHLYKLEMASWYGTDVFLEKYQNREKINGYFSYLDNQTPKCVFFSEGETPKIIGTIYFDSTYNVEKAGVDLNERLFTDQEKSLYAVRKTALQIISTDTFFSRYKNVNFNFIPIVSNNEKKVYVLSGTNQQGLVIIGNDYLLDFNNDNKLISKKRLHKNIIPISTKPTSKEGEISIGASHSHLPETGDFITATDICTLMLYQKLTNWEQHTVISAKYLNIWNCQTNELTVLPRETVEKIKSANEKN